MIRYLYYREFNPPATFVHVRIRCPQTGAEIAEVPALVDTAADRTTVPGAVIDALALKPASERSVSAYGGSVSIVPIYLLQISIRDLEVLKLEVFGNKYETYVILGRDVLNRYRILFDGPQLALEIS